MPLKAKDAIRGSPSPWNVLAMTPREAVEIVKRPRASARLRVVLMTIQCHGMSIWMMFRFSET